MQQKNTTYDPQVIETDYKILEGIIAALDITPYEIAKRLELASPMVLYLVQGKKRPLSKNVKNTIILRFPELNPDFVKNGIGKPLKLQRALTEDDKKAIERLNTEEISQIYPLLLEIKAQNEEILAKLKK